MFKGLFKEKTEEEKLRAYYLNICKKLPSKERKPFMDYVLGNIINVEIASEDNEIVDEYEENMSEEDYEEGIDEEDYYESDDELDETTNEELNDDEMSNENLKDKEVIENDEGFILEENDTLTDEETREIQNIEEEED